jgi:hypothetical protein
MAFARTQQHAVRLERHYSWRSCIR